METNWHLGTKLKIFWNFFFLILKCKEVHFSQGPGPDRHAAGPLGRTEADPFESLFPVSCSAADVEEDFHWNTGHSCKFGLCPKYSGTYPKKNLQKNGQLGPLLVQILFGKQFFLAKEPN